MRTVSSMAIAASLLIFHLACAASASSKPAAGIAGNTATTDAASGVGVEAPAGATKTDVRTNGLYAELYVPAHKRRLPALIAIGGAEGGLDVTSQMAVTFVPSGYAVLVLAYFHDPGLPERLEGVPLEYFHSAIEWLVHRPEIDPRRVGIIGWSRGAEAALLVASREPLIHAVVAVAPSSYVWSFPSFGGPSEPKPTWTVSGHAVPSVAPQPPKDFRPGTPIKVLFDSYLAQAELRPDAVIPVEKIKGPILLISGGDDHLSPSGEMAEQIISRLRSARFPYVYRHLSYAGAGHVAFVGNPSQWTGKKARSLVNPMLGGTLAADTTAWTDDWPKTLRFLAAALGPRSAYAGRRLTDGPVSTR
ncbi:MAG: acyl-CoA thioester hydrolase/BAAT C-terminal domain-containing protein [Steroidobacteraceae bacterium]